MDIMQRRSKTCFALTLLFWGISAFSLSMIPLANFLPYPVQGVVDCIIAGLFWLGLFAGLIITRKTNRVMYRAKRQLEGRRQKKQRFPGILTFRGTVKHVAVYAVFLVGFALGISDIVGHWIPESVMFPIISITIFAFELHCVIDGESYRVYKIVKEGLDNEN